MCFVLSLFLVRVQHQPPSLHFLKANPFVFGKNHTTDTSIWTEWTPERPSFRTTHQFSIEIIPFMFYEMIMRMTTMMMMMFLYDILINFSDCSLQHFVSGALSVSAPTPAITALPFAFTTLESISQRHCHNEIIFYE